MHPNACSKAQAQCHCLSVWENALDPGLLPVLLFGKIWFNECKAEFPTRATVPPTSPTCSLALSFTHTEAPGTSRMDTCSFSYGRLAINWLGHELSAGLTLSNFMFLRLFLSLQKFTSQCPCWLLCFRQLSGAGLNFCAVHSWFLLFFIRSLFFFEISYFKNNKNLKLCKAGKAFICSR